MDWQEQPSRAHLANREDSPAVLLDATASLPSLSPLSANPFKEPAVLDTISDGLSEKGSYDRIEIEAFKAATKNSRNPFLAEDDGDAPELKYSGEVPPYSGAGLFSLSLSEVTAADTKVRSDVEKFPVCQQDSSPDSPVELFSKQRKDSFPGDRKYIDDYGDKVAVTDSRSVREEYVDFKPFESTWASNENSGLKDSVKDRVDGKLESSIDKYDTEESKTPPAQKDFEKESESSNEDISFPSTPEATKESSQAYITCAKFESAEIVESNAAKSLPLVEEQASANKTDEKKIAEMKAHFGTEQSGTQAELASGQAQKPDFDKAESLPKKQADAVANIPEGLTPDLVQEAYESELHDAISPKLAYETQIDLVQTSELLQEPLNAAVQLCPSFEGGTETAPSPVLPDIVMEAPLSTSTVGVGGSAIQLEVSSSDSAAAAANDYENVMEKSEKPPSYQETVNVLTTQVQEPKVEIAAKEPDSQNAATQEDLETTYISIACDLVKETKVPNESASPAFTDYSKTVTTECVSQPVPEYPEHLEQASPLSGKSDLFVSQPECQFAQKEKEAVKEEKPLEMFTKLVPEEGQREKSEELQPPVSKPYLESFQPQLEPSKYVPAGWSPEVGAADLAKKQGPPQINMEELNTCSDDFTVFKEHQLWDKNVLSAESSPEADNFPSISYQTVESEVMGAMENGALKEDESSEILGAVKTELRQSPYQEVAQDLSLKNVPVRIEEQDLPLEKSSGKRDREVFETAKVPPLPGESIGKEANIGKEAERGVPSVKEKEKLSCMFSTKLSKPSGNLLSFPLHFTNQRVQHAMACVSLKCMSHYLAIHLCGDFCSESGHLNCSSLPATQITFPVQVTTLDGMFS